MLHEGGYHSPICTKTKYVTKETTGELIGWAGSGKKSLKGKVLQQAMEGGEREKLTQMQVAGGNEELNVSIGGRWSI